MHQHVMHTAEIMHLTHLFGQASIYNSTFVSNFVSNEYKIKEKKWLLIIDYIITFCNTDRGRGNVNTALNLLYNKIHCYLMSKCYRVAACVTEISFSIDKIKTSWKKLLNDSRRDLFNKLASSKIMQVFVQVKVSLKSRWFTWLLTDYKMDLNWVWFSYTIYSTVTISWVHQSLNYTPKQSNYILVFLILLYPSKVFLVLQYPS